ncbi:M24 family metallopeptidase [Ilumatobacter nonamiensis]|uniref:M24 family metallopeptidase n=1 Tax=Ilumatobacter nonamiensis TaxID=467093 RepID=UPI0003450D4C|nr:Xaa-Pro peptidase family protein [Ilumatobacter nonamiensis]
MSTELDASRLARLRASIADAECDAGLFYDPTNIRYATGTSNMQVYSLHNPCRYAFVPADGPVVLFEFKGCAHLSDDHDNVAEVRTAISWYDFVSGGRVEEFAADWAAEITDLVGSGTAVAIDRLDPIGLSALERRGITVHDGQRVANRARMIKTASEIDVIRTAVAACEDGLDEMRKVARPGMTENEVWSVLHQSNIASGGEWLETRLLTSGPRTNPWYQECSSKVIEPGELVAFDTDLIGIGGYSVDISRTWRVDDGTPTAEQRRLWDAAYEQLTFNTTLLQPGASFAEIAQRSHIPPADIHSVTNAAVAHGIGLCNEYPLILNRDHWEDGGYDGVVEEGMVLCVEALAAPPGGTEAIKLEEQVLITADGPESLSTYSLDLA